MITHLRGTLAEKSINRAVVDVNGVGYQVSIPLSTYDRLPKEGSEVTLKTVMHVREDAMQLFGFATHAERLLFTTVTSHVSGVGPKIGLDILSCMTVNMFCANVVNQDVKAITTIKGIGKRTAERLVVELKTRIKDIAPDVALTGRATVEGKEDETTAFGQDAEDAVAGLITLGIKADSARKCIREVINGLDGEPASREKLIRMALSQMNG